MLISSSNPDNDLATQARHIQHAKHVRLELRITCICMLIMYVLLFESVHLTSTSFSFSVGAVYLKNCIFKYWKREEVQEGEEVPLSIPDVSKVFIRDNIVTAIIKAPILIW